MIQCSIKLYRNVFWVFFNSIYLSVTIFKKGQQKLPRKIIFGFFIENSYLFTNRNKMYIYVPNLDKNICFVIKKKVNVFWVIYQ